MRAETGRMIEDPEAEFRVQEQVHNQSQVIRDPTQSRGQSEREVRAQKKRSEIQNNTTRGPIGSRYQIGITQIGRQVTGMQD